MRVFVCLAALVAVAAAVPAHHTVYVTGPIDTDGDGIPDNCDPDDDGDGIADPDKGDLCFQLAGTKGNPDPYHPKSHNPKSHNPKAYDPKAHDPKAYDPKAYDPYPYNPKAYDPYAHHSKTYDPKGHLPVDYYEPKKTHHHAYRHPKKPVWQHYINGYHFNQKGPVKGAARPFKYNGVNNYQPWNTFQKSYYYY